MAQSLGLRIAPGPRFAIDGAFERFVRLPFTLSEPDLQRAVARLAQTDRSLHRRAAHGLARTAWAVEAERVISGQAPSSARAVASSVVKSPGSRCPPLSFPVPCLSTRTSTRMLRTPSLRRTTTAER